MMHRTYRGWTLLATSAAILVISGCAATRSTLDIPVPVAESDAVVNPKAYVTIVRVTDARRFEASPRDPSVPSLRNPADLEDSMIRSRAVARKRGGFGKAMADILLPEDRTVEQLVREAATKALRERGYAVVDDKSPEQAKALPLELEIQQFWTWVTPGFATMKVEFESIVVMKGDALLAGAQESVRGYTRVESLAVTDGEWLRTMQQGVNDLIEQMKMKFS
jgi:uncharacterized lipoprotein YajG